MHAPPAQPGRSLARRRSLPRCRSIARRRCCYHYYHVPILQQHQRGVHMHTTSLNRNACTPSSAQAQQYIAACPAVRCYVGLRCAFVRIHSNTRYDAKYQVPCTVMYVRVVLVFLLSPLSRLPSLGPHVCTFSPPGKLHPPYLLPNQT